MSTNPKALYNMLRRRYHEDESLPVEKWQIEEYRELTTDELFNRLAALGIKLSEETFNLYAQNCDSPEDIVEVLWTDENDRKGQDKTYLLLFELWRRLLPEKQTLSLVCDEIDQRIEKYDFGHALGDELIQDSLADLEDLLDESVDAGGAPKEVFARVASYCAHDLESFIYDYISSQIEKKNDLFASELIDGFYDYFEDSRWLELLRARLFLSVDPYEAKILLERMVEELVEQPDLDILLELSYILAELAEEGLFFAVAKKILSLIEIEEDFQDLLAVTADFYRASGREEEEEEMRTLFSHRKKHDLEEPLKKRDRDLSALTAHLEEVENSRRS